MRRTRGIKRGMLDLKLSDILNDRVEYYTNIPELLDRYSISVIEDREFVRPDDMARAITILNRKYPTRTKCVFINLREESFDSLCLEALNDRISNVAVINPKTKVGVLAADLRDSSVVPVKFICNEDHLWEVPVDHLDMLSGGEYAYRRSVLDDESTKAGIDYVCNQINRYAHNDVEKVLLVDKMICKNLRFDNFVYTDAYNQMSYDEIMRTYNGRSVQGLLKNKKGVCVAFANLAALVLNKLEVPTRTVSGKYGRESHAWNKVKIGDKWYTCDFTHSLTLDRGNSKKYLLVEKASPFHVETTRFRDEIETHDMDRRIINQAFNRIKDVPIHMLNYQTQNNVAGANNSRRPMSVVKVKRREGTCISSTRRRLIDIDNN